MARLFNRAGMTVTGTPGTSAVSLNVAITSPKKYLSFSGAGVANGDQVAYLIEDGAEFEFGVGTYTSSGTTLSRDTVRESSNGGSKISATTAALVYIDVGAEDVEQAGSTTQAGRLEIATAAEVRTATDQARGLGVKETWDSSLNAVLTDAATIAVDFAAGYNFGGSTTGKLDLGGNRTLGAPSNVRGGMSGILWFGATGATRTLTFNAAWLLLDDRFHEVGHGTGWLLADSLFVVI